ncbi:MAG: response regulator [Flavobacterium psychrophilum]|nr:MAG: response regulator [Flavobacterium psychrophilum]
MKHLLKNIFLAEDDNDDVLFFKLALQDISADCNLTVFSNGQELISRLKESGDVPDILFLDINMPILNGLDTLKRVREFPALRSLPVVVYSTSSSELDIRQAEENGAGHYMVKPCNMDKLREVIERMLTYDWKNHRVLQESEEFVIRG